MNVSTSMIMRNEERRLEAALLSLRKIEAVDEVVIVDTGSTDRSVEIAKDLGARVFHEAWADDFSRHRNTSLGHCKNDWVFILDADEVVSDPGDLDRLFEAPPEDGLAVAVDCVGPGGSVVEQLLTTRAFDRRKGSWRYAVHNQIAGLGPSWLSTGRVTAYYDGDVLENTRRRLDVLLRHHETSPADPHYVFYITKSWRVLEEPEEVVRWGDRFFELGLKDARSAQVCAWLVQAHLALRRRDEAVELLRLGLTMWPDFPDLLHLHVALSVLRWAEAATHVNPAFAGVSSYSAPYVDGVPEAARLLGLPLARK